MAQEAEESRGAAAHEAAVLERDAGSAVEARKRGAGDAPGGRSHLRATARPLRVLLAQAVGAAVGVDAFAAVEAEGRDTRGAFVDVFIAVLRKVQVAG